MADYSICPLSTRYQCRKAVISTLHLTSRCALVHAARHAGHRLTRAGQAKVQRQQLRRKPPVHQLRQWYGLLACAGLGCLAWLEPGQWQSLRLVVQRSWQHGLLAHCAYTSCSCQISVSPPGRHPTSKCSSLLADCPLASTEPNRRPAGAASPPAPASMLKEQGIDDQRLALCAR